MRIAVFLGYSESGKTTAIESLVSWMASRGHRVGALKHIHGESYELDKKGKDSWRFAQAGAAMVMAVSAEDGAISTFVRAKKNSKGPTLQRCIDEFEKEDVNYLLVEGFYSEIKKLRRDILKKMIFVLCARNQKDMEDLLLKHNRKNITCVIGNFKLGSTTRKLRDIPFLGFPPNPQRLFRLTFEGNKMKRKRKSK